MEILFKIILVVGIICLPFIPKLYDLLKFKLTKINPIDRTIRIDNDIFLIKLLLDKAFNELGMHKVYSYAFYKLYCS